MKKLVAGHFRKPSKMWSRKLTSDRKDLHEDIKEDLKNREGCKPSDIITSALMEIAKLILNVYGRA